MGGDRSIVLREHELAPIPPGLQVSRFISYLDEVWMKRLSFSDLLDEVSPDTKISSDQPFFRFTYDGKIKARNYIGFIRWEGYSVEVIPKLFHTSDPLTGKTWEHLFYWLKYCRRIRFPFSNIESSPEFTDNLPESLIHTFAKYTHALLCETPFLQYEEVNESAQVLRGRLNLDRYIGLHYSKGNPHILAMEYEPFVHDNRLNRIIRFVAESLQQSCRFTQTWEILQGIIFQLEDVNNIPVVYEDCDRVRLNRHFSSYGLVLDMCRFFLRESYLVRETGSMQNLCFLFPMEYVFEDFLAGFIEYHFSDRFHCYYQRTGWLTDQGVFQIRNDLVLTDQKSGKEIIIDAKYKLRDTSEKEKRGISQTDLYQMTAYSLRGNCDTILLIYPNCEKTSVHLDRFTISSPMMPDHKVTIHAWDLRITFDDTANADLILREKFVWLFETIYKELI